MNPWSAVASTTLVGLGALHAGWGAGASFPFGDREALANNVAGSTVAPSPRDCFGVAAVLFCAAGLVGDVLPINPRARAVGVLGVAAVLGGRGALGVAGRTGSIVPWTPNARFEELDRRYYGPLCLAVSGGALLSLRHSD